VTCRSGVSVGRHRLEPRRRADVGSFRRPRENLLDCFDEPEFDGSTRRRVARHSGTEHHGSWSADGVVLDQVISH
jgi:hypothetical protein